MTCPIRPRGWSWSSFRRARWRWSAFPAAGPTRLLAEQEDRLRGWLAKRGVKGEGEPEYAFYNSPMIPGPLRRNEVWLALS